MSGHLIEALHFVYLGCSADGQLCADMQCDAALQFSSNRCNLGWDFSIPLPVSVLYCTIRPRNVHSACQAVKAHALQYVSLSRPLQAFRVQLAPGTFSLPSFACTLVGSLCHGTFLGRQVQPCFCRHLSTSHEKGLSSLQGWNHQMSSRVDQCLWST